MKPASVSAAQCLFQPCTRATKWRSTRVINCRRRASSFLQLASSRASFAKSDIRIHAELSGRPAAGCARISLKVSSGESSEKNAFGLSKAEVVSLSGAAILTALIGAAVFLYDTDFVQEALYGDGLGYNDGISLGDATGALLWGISLYFVSPLQTLLLFLGKTDTDRPSDAVITVIGKVAGLPVDAADYEAPLPVRLSAGAFFLGAGVTVASFFDWAFGEATWSISTGLGSCLIAAVYELGRPKRLTVEEQMELDAQWSDFVGFADDRLQRSGRCHFTEIASAFRNAPGNAKYRSQEVLTDSTLKTMVANWAPYAERSPSGYYKGLSVKERTDPFQ